MARLHQEDFQPGVLEDLVDRHPVVARALYRHRAYAALQQPVAQGVQIPGEARKGAHRILRAVRRHRHHQLLRADVDARRVGMACPCRQFPVPLVSLRFRHERSFLSCLCRRFRFVDFVAPEQRRSPAKSMSSLPNGVRRLRRTAFAAHPSPQPPMDFSRSTAAMLENGVRTPPEISGVPAPPMRGRPTLPLNKRPTMPHRLHHRPQKVTRPTSRFSRLFRCLKAIRVLCL